MKISLSILALLLVGAMSMMLWNVAVAQPPDSTIDVSHLQQASPLPEPIADADSGGTDPKSEAPAAPAPKPSSSPEEPKEPKEPQESNGKDEPAKPEQDSAPEPQPAPGPGAGTSRACAAGGCLR